MQEVDGDFLVIAVMSIQIADGNQTLNLAVVIHHWKMANAVLTEDAAGVVN